MKISPPEGVAGRVRHWRKNPPVTGGAPAIAGTQITRYRANRPGAVPQPCALQ